jgi:hypothetical protein
MAGLPGWPLSGPTERSSLMIALASFLVIVAMVPGIVGVVARGLLYLLLIGVVGFLGALVLGAMRMRRRLGPGRHGLPGWLTSSQRGWLPRCDRSW